MMKSWTPRRFRLALVVASLLLIPSVSSFHVGTTNRFSNSNKVACHSSPFQKSTATNNNKRRSNDNAVVLSVRGGGALPLRALVVDTLALVNNFYQTSPYLAAALTCGGKASAADYVAQRRQSKSNSGNTKAARLDTARNIAFLVYGAIYQGMAQEVRTNGRLSCLLSYGTSYMLLVPMFVSLASGRTHSPPFRITRSHPILRSHST